MRRRTLFALTVAAMCTTSPLWAQQTMRVRGTVEGMDGALYVVKTRDGETLKVAVTDKPLFVAMVKARMADNKPRMFVGATAVPGSHSRLDTGRAHIFPPAIR